MFEVVPSSYTGARVAIPVPSLGLVLKIAKIHPMKGLRSFCKMAKSIGFSRTLARSVDAKGMVNFKMWWYKGLADNLREFLFFLLFRHPMLVPTYFSFFGIFNVQKLVKVISKEDFEGRKVWRQFYQLTQGEVFEDGHHFQNRANFCITNGHLQMLDYGSLRTRTILRKWANVLYSQIDLNTPPD